MKTSTLRMKMRVGALFAVGKAIMPGFCEDQMCNETCDCWIQHEGVFREESHCKFHKARMEIEDLASSVCRRVD